MGSITRVSVLVHPHYGEDYLDDDIPAEGAYRGPLPGRLRAVTGGNKQAEQTLRSLHGLFRFYAGEIDAIGRRRENILVLVKDRFDDPVGTAQALAARGIPPDTARKIREIAVGYQGRLARYAERRLGERLLATSEHPKKIGRWLRQRLAVPPSSLRSVEVFGEEIGAKAGEHLDGCVDWAHGSLKGAGYSQAEVIASKSVISKAGRRE